MRAELQAVTWTGPVRARNEDRVLLLNALLDEGVSAVSAEEGASFFERTGALWAAVADGVGGAPAGDVASRVALESLRDRFVDEVPVLPPGAEREFLSETMRRANERVIERGAREPATAGMATTVSGVLMNRTGVHVFHAGDSRVYRLADGSLVQLTRDHATPGMIAQAAGMSLEEAVETGSAALNNCLGARRFESDMRSGPVLEAGERLLVCTDGVFGPVSRDRIEALMGDPESSLADAARRLAADAVRGGGQDNISLVLIGIEGDSGLA